MIEKRKTIPDPGGSPITVCDRRSCSRGQDRRQLKNCLPSTWFVHQVGSMVPLGYISNVHACQMVDHIYDNGYVWEKIQS